MTVPRIGCMVRVCTCHDDHAWTYPGSYPEGCSACGCHRPQVQESCTSEPTRCHECERRTETWIMVYLSDFDRAPVCLRCAQNMGWLPTGQLSPALEVRS